MIIGIDPGYSGAIAVLFNSGDVSVCDMPVDNIYQTKSVKKKVIEDGAEVIKKKHKQYVSHKLSLSLIEQYLRDCMTTANEQSIRDTGLPFSGGHVFIEKSQPMPKQGVVSVGNYMYAYGQLIALLFSLRLSYTEVIPVVWKRVMFFGMAKADGKINDLIRARQLFPQIEIPKTKDGRADALLIAEYGRRSLTPTAEGGYFGSFRL